MRDDGHLIGIGRDGLLVTRVVVDKRLGEEEVTSAAAGDVTFFGIFVVDPGDGGWAKGEVGVAEDVAGGNEASTVSRGEPYAVENSPVGVERGGANDVAESFHGGWRDFGD